MGADLVIFKTSHDLAVRERRALRIADQFGHIPQDLHLRFVIHRTVQRLKDERNQKLIDSSVSMLDWMRQPEVKKWCVRMAVLVPLLAIAS